MHAPPHLRPLSRRGFMKALFAAPFAYLLAACGLRPVPTPTQAPASQSPASTPTPQPTTASPTPAPSAAPSLAAQSLAPTPACTDDDDVTPPQAEGPFYTPNTPQRTSFLEPGLSGASLVVTGLVLSTDCQPVPNTLIDFWHCDDAGVYDNAGFKLRGHQFTDASGAFRLDTIVPGLYPGRTRHIHVKVQAANQPVLTTQLYFPGEPGNATDGIYQPELEMTVQDSADGQAASFNFVLALG